MVLINVCPNLWVHPADVSCAYLKDCTVKIVVSGDGTHDSPYPSMEFAQQQLKEISSRLGLVMMWEALYVRPSHVTSISTTSTHTVCIGFGAPKINAPCQNRETAVHFANAAVMMVNAGTQ